jgi:chromosome segregation ATPase
MTQGEKGIAQWLRGNAWNLIVTMFLIGGAYGSLRVENNWRDDRITNVMAENAKYAEKIAQLERSTTESRWITAQNTGRIDALQTESKNLGQAVAEIKVQIGTLTVQLVNVDKKLDRVIEAVERKN